MDEIVVAKKANLLASYILFIILGAVFVGLGVYFAIRQSDSFWAILLVCGGMGLICVIVGICMIIKYKKTPKNFITYKDGLFTFADGTTCAPNEITHVLVKLTRQNGVVNSTGGLVVTINGTRKIEYHYVANVRQVQSEIQMITDEYNARLYRENPAMQAAQPVQPADPFAIPAAPAAPADPFAMPAAPSEPAAPADPFDFSGEDTKNEH